MSRFNVVRSMKNTSEIVKLRRVVERIEKRLDKAFELMNYIKDDEKRI